MLALQAWDAQSENAPQEDYSYGQQVQEEVLVKAPGSDRERILRQHLERALNEVRPSGMPDLQQLLWSFLHPFLYLPTTSTWLGVGKLRGV